MQQFLIPSQNGPSQIINIPVSLLSQANQQPISFITSTGQIFQLPSFYNPNAAQQSAGASGGNNAGAANSAANNAVTAASSSSTASTTTGQTTTATAQAGQTLVINHQGQLISLPVLQQQQQQQFTTAGGNQSGAGSSVVNLTNAQFHHVPTQVVTTATTSRGSGGSAAAAAAAAAAANGTTPIKTLLEDDDKEGDDQGPTIASMPQGMSQMPGQITHGTTVDGVNLDEIREFAKAFKLRRLALGLTQTQVGQALSATKGPAYSQSAICRFEKLDITPKSAAKIKPVLEKWMQEAELKYADRLKSGSQHNFADLLGTENTKKRKRRTSFTPQALEILNEYFEKNSHPSADFNGNQGADMTMLAQKLNYDREVIRVWFCNKRQALKNSMKKMKQANEGNGGVGGADLSSDNSNLSSPNTSLNASSGGVTVTTTPTATINATLTHQQQLNAAQIQQQLVHQHNPQLHQVVVVQQPSQTQIQLPAQTTATTLVIAQAPQPQQVIEQQIVQHVSESEANKTVTNGSSSPVLIKSETNVGSVVVGEEQQSAVPTENGTETTESVVEQQQQQQMDTEEASEVAAATTVVESTPTETAEETNNNNNEVAAAGVVVEDSVSQVQSSSSSEQTESNNNNNNESDTTTTNVESTINTAESSNNAQVNA